MAAPGKHAVRPVALGRTSRPKPGRASRKGRMRRSLSLTARLLGFLSLLLVIGAGLAYVRIKQAPMSLKFLVSPIEQGLNQELSGLSVRIEDAVVRRGADGFEFRLTNVLLSDRAGVPVALAPSAAIQISGNALMKGRLAASRIDLIGARLLLFQAPDGSVSIRYAEGTADSSAEAETQSVAAEAAGAAAVSAGLPLLLKRLDLAKTLADASARARRRIDASSFLRAVGLRQSTVILDHGGRRQFWRVPSFDVRLWHAKDSSRISSRAVFNSNRGPWSMKLTSEDSELTKQVTLKGEIRNLVPQTLARSLPQLALLNAFDMPVSGNSTIKLETDGSVLGGDIAVKLAAGTFRLPWLDGLPLRVDGGRLALRYDSKSRSMMLAPSRFEWGNSHVTLTGSIVPAPPQNGRQVWKFDLKSVDGRLANDEFGGRSLPIRQFTITGWITPDIGRVQVAQAYLNVDGAEVAVSADVVDVAGVPRARLEGRIGAMPLEVFKALWPQALAPEARRYAAARLNKGRITSGVFKLSSDAGETPSPAGGSGLSLSAQAEGLEWTQARGLPVVSAARALVRLEGNGVEVTIPDALVAASGTTPLKMKSVRFTAVDLSAVAPLSELAFHSNGKLSELAGVLRAAKVEIPGLTAEQTKLLDGKFNGQFTARLPLKSTLQFSDIDLKGRVAISDGKGKIPGTAYKINGATAEIDISQKAVNVIGQTLLNGVVVKVNAQHIFGVPGYKQPPVRIVTALDGTDRRQLGMDVDHLVSGTLPIEATVLQGPLPDGAKAANGIRVRVDLTGAELLLKAIAWRKPPGRRAVLEFNVGKGTVYPVELQNFKLVGEGLAIEGWVALDDKNEPREFYFPEFSVNIVTRLEVQGALRVKDHVWDIKAKGATFDGRDMFRSFYDVGSLDAKTKSTRRRIPGIDLVASVDNVIGFGDTSLRNVSIKMKERGDEIQRLDAKGLLAGSNPLNVSLEERPGKPRVLVANTNNAGEAFKLVGFYPNLRKGRAVLQVNLDGQGVATKTGLLEVRKFSILGDAVVSEVLQNVDGSRPAIDTGARRGRSIVRERFDFDSMKVPFSVGEGQFVLSNSNIKGPLIGASIRGKVDFKESRIDLGGTYVPLHGLNSALGYIPVLGQLLAGPRGEGVLGITFAIQGKLSQPQVIVNPLSMLTPGFLRGLMELTPQNPKLKKRRTRAGAGGSAKPAASSSSPAVTGGGSADGWSSTTAPKVDGWSSQSVPR